MVLNTNVLVTGVGGGGVGEQIIFALRVAETPYRIIGTDMDPHSLGLYSVDKGYVIPHSADESYVARLLEICEQERVSVLIPGSEAELVKISESREIFKDHNVTPLINSDSVISRCLNKWEAYLFLKEEGFKVPISYNLAAMRPLDMGVGLWDDEVEYPVIVKPYLGTGGSRLVFVAQNEGELNFFIGYIRRNGGEPMIQDYVGSAEGEFTIGVLTSFEGDLLGSIALKRRLSGRLSTLYTVKNHRDSSKPLRVSTGISQGLIDDFPEVRRNAERIALALDSRGPINVQCRVVDGESFVFEINPRFSGTESLRALAGYNAPDALIRKHVLGEEVTGMNFKRGWASRGLTNHFVAC